MSKVSRRVCAVSDCTKPNYSKGYCQQHYQRWRVTGDPLKTPKMAGLTNPPPRTPRTCSVEGCERDHAAHGLCLMHFKREQRGYHNPTSTLR